MKKIIVLLILLSIFAVPAHALNILDKLRYKEVQLGREKVLVNRITGRVEQRFVGGNYEPLSSVKGWGGIPSPQDVYQAKYDKVNK